MRLYETTDPFQQSLQIRQRFIDWWKDSTDLRFDVSDQHLNDKIQVIYHNNIPYVNCEWAITVSDHRSTDLPVRFGKCNRMNLDMPKLATLKNTPRQCNLFVLEQTQGGAANNVLTSIVDGPEHAEHIAFSLANPLENLATSLKSPIDSIWLHVPEVKSFEGITVPVRELTINAPFQKSITGIHKQLKNVLELNLVLPGNFEGGLLSLALIRGLQSIGTEMLSNNGNAGYKQAIVIINEGLHNHSNVHEIQEQLIEAGLGKFARM